MIVNRVSIMGNQTLVFEFDTIVSLAGSLYLLLALGSAAHVVLNKQSEGAAFSWLGIIVLSPVLGVLLYWLFGINRIRRRAQAERPQHASRVPPHRDAAQEGDSLAIPDAADRLPARWQQLLRLGCAIHAESYVEGNALEPLVDGDTAYPRMLDSIASAQQTIRLSSYIFSHDEIGKQFVDALAVAQQRGVQVRVLIDGIGVSYGPSWQRVDRALRKRGVQTARFLSAFSTSGTRFLNLRNHRKILVVDGELAFVGGLNIRENNLVCAGGRHRTRDVHFSVTGPVVKQIDKTFCEDWQFATQEYLQPSSPSAPVDSPKDGVLARVLLDGPDENYAKLQMTMLGAINAARYDIRIVSPYFLPEPSVVHALQLAALRGVRVEVIVPQKNNLPFVGWAMQANQWRLVEFGILLFESPAPFDHSKLFLVDNTWTLIGSSNWDARSLELNFEVNVECYDTAFNASVGALVDAKRDTAFAIVSVPERPLLIRLRNNFCRLFSPYL